MAGLKIEQDALRDTVTINGVSYSRALFEDLAATRRTGQVVRIVSDSHGTLTMERVDGATHLTEELIDEMACNHDIYGIDAPSNEKVYAFVREVIASHVMQSTSGNRISVDRGALQMALDVLRRSRKNEVADALATSASTEGMPTVSGTPSDWVDANVSGNPTLMKAMKSFAENAAEHGDQEVQKVTRVATGEVRHG